MKNGRNKEEHTMLATINRRDGGYYVALWSDHYNAWIEHWYRFPTRKAAERWVEVRTATN
jgi:hypothetical protein